MLFHTPFLEETTDQNEAIIGDYLAMIIAIYK